MSATVPPAVTIQELIGAGLLRRADMLFVERRRFAEAAERERRGLPRPPGSPPVGTSPGVELLLTGTMTPLLGDSAWIDMRLVDPATGGFRSAWRVGVPRGADPNVNAEIKQHVRDAQAIAAQVEDQPAAGASAASAGTDAACERSAEHRKFLATLAEAEKLL